MPPPWSQQTSVSRHRSQWFQDGECGVYSRTLVTSFITPDYRAIQSHPTSPRARQRIHGKNGKPCAAVDGHLVDVGCRHQFTTLWMSCLKFTAVLWRVAVAARISTLHLAQVCCILSLLAICFAIRRRSSIKSAWPSSLSHLPTLPPCILCFRPLVSPTPRLHTSESHGGLQGRPQGANEER
jgi:hypothetical protein